MAGSADAHEIDADVSYIHYGRPGGIRRNQDAAWPAEMGSQQTRGVFGSACEEGLEERDFVWRSVPMRKGMLLEAYYLQLERERELCN